MRRKGGISPPKNTILEKYLNKSGISPDINPIHLTVSLLSVQLGKAEQPIYPRFVFHVERRIIEFKTRVN